MKQILKTFAVVGIVLLTALMAAGSCDKDDKSNNNNSNNNNNNNNNDNGGGTFIERIIITNFATGLAKMTGTEVLLKASAFPEFTAMTSSASLGDVISGPGGATRVAKVFDITFDKASGGMIIVTEAKADGTPLDFNKPAEFTKLSLPTTDGLGNKKEGVLVEASATDNNGRSAGLNIFSAFLNNFTADANSRPIFWCVAVAPGLTDISDHTTLGAKTLAGSQKADCYVATLGGESIGIGTGRNANWLTSSTTTKELSLAAYGLKTDSKTLLELLPGGLATLVGGIDATELDNVFRGLSTANGGKLDGIFQARSFKIKIVSDSDFAK